MAAVIRVLDASVAVEWFFPTNDVSGKSADVVLDAIQADPSAFAVPSLFLHELHGVLCRRSSSASVADASLAAVWKLGMRVIPFDLPSAGTASALAFQWGLGSYDATYVAAAKMIGGVWLTRDGKAHERIASLGLSELLGDSRT